MKPSVLFITKICFLDAALEYIDEVKNYVDLRVIIEIDPFSKNKNIINIENLPNNITFINAKDILSTTVYLNFKNYINNCKSFEFLIHQNKKSFSFSSIKKSILLFIKTKTYSPQFIHFDDVSIRLLTFGFFFNFLNAKLIMNVHDPIQHSGEKNMIHMVVRKIIFRKINKFITFSNYSKLIFHKKYGNNKFCINLHLKPYKFYRNFIHNIKPRPHYISFIGRVSEYKGIDIFLDAIKILNTKYPNIEYLIAGAPINNILGLSLKKRYTFKNVKFILRHLTNTEICDYIQDSKVIICPYRDATQSGIIMTSLALHTPIIASNKGGLPEYIQNDITGMIVNADALSFVSSIETIILNKFKANQMSQNIVKFSFNKFNFGEKKILDLYS
jgi:glycosyltransferase involved in cell wall biosynthesis